jgi:hypothetical protein
MTLTKSELGVRFYPNFTLPKTQLGVAIYPTFHWLFIDQIKYPRVRYIHAVSTSQNQQEKRVDSKDMHITEILLARKNRLTWQIVETTLYFISY